MVQYDPKEVLQMELETLFNKNQIKGRIKHEFTHCTEYDFTGHMRAIGLDIDFGYDLLVAIAIHKRASLPTLVGILRHHCRDLQHCADSLLIAAEGDLIDWDPNTQIFIVKFPITKEVQQEIDTYQFPLPMVVEPKEIIDNKTSGYLLSNGSVILKDNHHEDDVCLDHLNRMNQIKFSINENVMTMIRNKWSSLDKPKQGETKEDYLKRVKAFDKYDRTSREVMAKLISSGNEMYLTHKFDKRGRIYCQGYHVNYQGTAWNKAVVELTEGIVVE